MKYAEFKELFSHEFFSTDTMKIEACILNPCYYDKEFELEFDELPSPKELFNTVKYLRRVGAEKIILNFRKDDDLGPLKLLIIFQSKERELSLDSVEKILKVDDIFNKVVIFKEIK